MLREVLIVLVILSSLPVGWLLAYLCRDELVAGRKWFKVISVICAILIVLLLIIRISSWLEISLGLAYLGIISLVALKLSYNKKFVR